MESSTKVLRKLLDERGVEWREGDDERKTHWESSGLTWEYFNDENGDAWLGFLGVCESDVSPEQAIAATLGSGKLTADDVRDLIEHNSYHVSGNTREFFNGAYEAIADELNATLGSVTCKPTEEDYCPICGEDLVKCNIGIGAGGGAVELDPPIYHNYCPNCGVRVIGG